MEKLKMQSSGYSTVAPLLTKRGFSLVFKGTVLILLLITIAGFLNVYSLEDRIDQSEIYNHLDRLSHIALSHPKKSRSILNAYNATVDYIMEELKSKTDCKMKIQRFLVPIWENYGTPTLVMKNPLQIQFKNLVDFRIMRNGGEASTLEDERLFHVKDGCNIANFTGFSGGIVLVLLEKPNCELYNIALNAEKVHAKGLFFYQPESATALSFARIIAENWLPEYKIIKIPVFSVSYSVGQLFMKAPESKVSLTTNSGTTITTTSNVLCETREGDDNNIIMMGAHADSVPEGPGLVDNGSGTSSLLHLFLKMYETGFNKKLVNKVRFGWWGAEEIGLHGSRYYTRTLKANNTEFKKVVVYSNFDMLGSPNYIPYILRGDSAPEPLRFGSRKIQGLYEEYFNSLPRYKKFYKKYAFKDMYARSDFKPFLDVGIHAGGLATGADVIKTVDDRQKFGGLANAQTDPCYHQSCDTIENVSMEILTSLTECAAHVLNILGTKKDIRKWMSE
jgi:hypothetical protein